LKIYETRCRRRRLRDRTAPPMANCGNSRLSRAACPLLESPWSGVCSLGVEGWHVLEPADDRLGRENSRARLTFRVTGTLLKMRRVGNFFSVKIDWTQTNVGTERLSASPEGRLAAASIPASSSSSPIFRFPVQVKVVSKQDRPIPEAKRLEPTGTHPPVLSGEGRSSSLHKSALSQGEWSLCVKGREEDGGAPCSAVRAP